MSMTVITRKNSILDYFVVILFVITSGSVFYKINFSGSITYLFLLFVGIINKQRIRNCKAYDLIENNSSWWFVVFIAVWAIIGHIYYSHSYDDKNLLGYVVVLIAAYFIISSYNFYYFRKLLTNVIYVITLIGIPIFILNEIEILPTYNLQLPNERNYTMFFVYTLGWPAMFHRYSGIWHEPGAGQIFLNIVLWLYLDCFISWRWEKGVLKKILLIGIGSIITFSTGSYISLMLLFISVSLSIKLKSRHKLLLRIALVGISLLAAAMMFNSDVIQKKMFSDDDESISKRERTADALALYQMATDRPFLGYGLGTHDYWSTSTKLGNTSNSSGLLTFSASFGVIWLIVFIVVIYFRIKKMGYGKEAIFMLLSILLMQSNENYIEYLKFRK